MLVHGSDDPTYALRIHHGSPTCRGTNAANNGIGTRDGSIKRIGPKHVTLNNFQALVPKGK
jgi:hypothetical protein